MERYSVSCFVLIIASATRLSCYPAASKRPEPGSSTITIQTRITMRFGIANAICTSTLKHASLGQLQPPLNDPAPFTSSKNKEAKCGSFLQWTKCEPAAGKIERCLQFECTSTTAPSQTKSAETKIKVDAIKSSKISNGEQKGNPDEHGEYFQGDMNISKTAISKLRSGLINDTFRWKNNLVVYKIVDGFTQEEISLINASLKSISDNTCIKFKVRTDKEDYVAVISMPSGCVSQVGFQEGEQFVNYLEKIVWKAKFQHMSSCTP